MSTTITGKLNKAANVFQAGESTGFGIRLGVQYYDRETRQKEWTNYECAVFAGSDGQINFYKVALVEGAIVEITGKQAKIKSFDGQNGQMLSIELIDAAIGYIGTADNNNAQARTPSQNANQASQNMQAPDDGFDDDIVF